MLPAFLFLAGGMLLVALAFAFLGVETHGKAIEELASEDGAQPARAALGAG